jgi:hypothetical protein
MNRMRKCNDEVYQLAKDQALVKKLKNKRFRPLADLKCITIDGKKCDNIEDICNNFNNHFSSTEKLDNWVSSKLSLENSFSYTCILPEEVEVLIWVYNCSYLQYLLIYKVGLL